MDSVATTIRQLLNHQQLLKAIRQGLAAPFAHDHHIFDATAQLVRDEDAWLDSEAHALPQHGRVAAGQEWRLMHVHADPVTKPMAECLAVAGIGDHRARGGIGLRAGIILT